MLNANHPTLDIIIVNWNSGFQLAQCLLHIEGASKHGFHLREIVIVDNASNDSSLKAAQRGDEHTVVIRNSKNAGFAAACNQGAEGSHADYLLFLNPDVFLGENTLSISVRFLANPVNAGVAICGPRLVGLDGRTQRTCSRFPSSKDFYAKALGLDRAWPEMFRSSAMVEWDHQGDRAVEQLIGACLFIRREVFEQLGGFDERFFVYFEEVDLCLRCRKAGWEIHFLSTTSATHLGGGCSRQVLAARLFYSLRSRVLYAFKHFSAINAYALCLMTCFVEPFSRLVLAAARGSLPEFRATLAGYWPLWSSMPSILRQARMSTKRNAQASASRLSSSRADFTPTAQRMQ